MSIRERPLVEERLGVPGQSAGAAIGAVGASRSLWSRCSAGTEQYLWLFSPERRGFHNSFLMFDSAIRLITPGALPPARVCRGQTGRQTPLLQRADAFSPAPAGIRVISAGMHARAGVNSASPTPDSDED